MFRIESAIMLPCPLVSTVFRPRGCQIGCQTSETRTRKARLHSASNR
jgi:hypothetical protein